MSWSVAAKGKALEVKTDVAGQFERASKCAEPEESIRLATAKLIDLSLEAQDPEKDVSVSAYGSQSADYQTQKVRNSLNITISPQG